MGAVLSDCYYAYCAPDYETIPEDASEWNKMPTSPASSTGFGYLSDGTTRSAKDNEVSLPHSFQSSYIMGELIGVGTTAEVFRVSYKDSDGDPSRQQPLVCKVIDKRGITYSMDGNDPYGALHQLWREVEILKRIRHPNIVAYYDYIETKDRLYIITERLEGGELFEYILNNGALEEAFACRVLYGVFSAIAYLHERGVVHRDIKAENLIFFQDGQGQPALKLIDFGFSTIVDRHSAGTFLGTGGYIAPEIRQNKDYTTSVDMWSLGVLVYCAISARLPFDFSLETLPDDIDSCRQTFDLQFPQKLFGNVSERCMHLITQLLEVDPARRISAAEALNHPWFAAHHRAAQLPPRAVATPATSGAFHAFGTSQSDARMPQWAPQDNGHSYSSSSASSCSSDHHSGMYQHPHLTSSTSGPHPAAGAQAATAPTPQGADSKQVTPRARHDYSSPAYPSPVPTKAPSPRAQPMAIPAYSGDWWGSSDRGAYQGYHAVE